MLLRTFRIFSFAAASALAVLTFAPLASANELRANLGPVGPSEPILATVGKARMIATYERDDGKCAVSAVVFTTSPRGGGKTSTRVRVALHPGELFKLDVVRNKRIVLACGPNARLLTVLNRGELMRKPVRNVVY